jgi:hypothetical protein
MTTVRLKFKDRDKTVTVSLKPEELGKLHKALDDALTTAGHAPPGVVAVTRGVDTEVASHVTYNSRGLAARLASRKMTTQENGK